MAKLNGFVLLWEYKLQKKEEEEEADRNCNQGQDPSFQVFSTTRWMGRDEHENVLIHVTFWLTFSSLSGSPLQRVLRETLKDFHTGLKLFMTV